MFRGRGDPRFTRVLRDRRRCPRMALKFAVVPLSINVQQAAAFRRRHDRFERGVFRAFRRVTRSLFAALINTNGQARTLPCATRCTRAVPLWYLSVATSRVAVVSGRSVFLGVERAPNDATLGATGCARSLARYSTRRARVDAERSTKERMSLETGIFFYLRCGAAVARLSRECDATLARTSWLLDVRQR